MENSKEQFGSRFAAIAALAGSAIGLGCIWRFPYMVGENGGAAYIIIYIATSLLLCIPIFFAEFIIGRRSGANCLGAMRRLAPGSKWKWLGALCIITPTIILSYYTVVGGWSLAYLAKSFNLGFPDSFGSFSASPRATLSAFMAYLVISCLIVAAGVKKGIAAFSKVSIPVLFLLIVFLAAYSVSLEGSAPGIDYLFKPEWSKVTARTVIDALGQGFYSLSLGMGIIVTYSSYIQKSDNMVVAGIGTAGFTLFFAILAGLAIMPAVFAAGIEPASGPGLIFDSLPFIFTSLSSSTSPVLGTIIAVLFFLTVNIAALTSSISLIEVPVAWLIEEKGFRRWRAVLLVFAVTVITGAPCALSSGIFGALDRICCNILLPIGGILCVYFVGWKMPKADVRDEFCSGGTLKANGRLFGTVYFLIKYLAPLAIAAIFLSNFL
jgi:NSS family neurotransmitter:Na+ symporter